MNGLRTKQQSFRQFTEQYVELYTVEHLLSCRAALLSSRHAALSSSRHAAISSSRLTSHRPLVLAPPSHRLIVQVGCCCVVSCCATVSSSRPLVAPHSRPLVFLSLHRPLAISSRRLVVASTLVALSPCPLVVLVKNMVSRCWVKSPNGFCDFLATTI